MMRSSKKSCDLGCYFGSFWMTTFIQVGLNWFRIYDEGVLLAFSYVWNTVSSFTYKRLPSERRKLKLFKFKKYNCFDEIFMQDITGLSYRAFFVK